MQYNVIFYFFYTWKILSLYSFRFLSRIQRLFRWERWECDILSRLYMSWVYVPLFVRRLRSSGSGLRRCEGLRRRHRRRLEYMRGCQLWGSRMFAIRMPVNWLISCWLKNQNSDSLFSIFVEIKNSHARIDGNVYRWLKCAMVFVTAQMHLMKVQNCAKHMSMYIKNNSRLRLSNFSVI